MLTRMESLRGVTLICFVVVVRAVFFILKWAVLIVLLGATWAVFWGVGYGLGLCLHGGGQ